MAKYKDLTNNKYGKLQVVSLVGFKEHLDYKEPIWLCRCDCGNEKSIGSRSLLHSVHGSKSCGCSRVDTLKKNPPRKTHGMSKNTPIYNVWKAMKKRCCNPNTHNYSSYGGRGISVCQRWQEFTNFYDDMSPNYLIGLTIERIDVNGDYCPENCTWATYKEQGNNKRNTVYLHLDGLNIPLQAASEIYGIDEGTIRYRINNGWDHKLAVTTPSRKSNKKV